MLRGCHAGVVLLALACTFGSPCVRAGDAGETEERTESIVRPESGFLSPRLELHGFADLTLEAERVKPDGEDGTSTSAIKLGEIDFYLTAALSDSVSFFLETVIEFPKDEDAVVDVERFFAKYSFSDRLWVSAGRRHTILGYWNRAYHHGLLLQPTIERPHVIRFEDDGGILPIHAVGVEAGGRRFRGAWGVDYAASISNGRSSMREEVQDASDQNSQKAFNASLNLLREEENRQLQMGTSYGHDVIPPDPVEPDRQGEIHETIIGANLRYQDRRFEAICEYYGVRHEDQVTGTTFRHRGYFVVVVWRPWKVKPYVGLDRLDLKEGDPYYADLEPEVRQFLAGVRFDYHALRVAKFEYRHDRREGFTTDAIAVQLAFSF